MSSILTNTSAMVALQNLKSINMDLSKTQNKISTGKSISSASDNASMWAISKVMESDVAGFSAISKSLALGESTVAVAAAGADKIVEILKELLMLHPPNCFENVLSSPEQLHLILSEPLVPTHHELRIAQPKTHHVPGLFH